MSRELAFELEQHASIPNHPFHFELERRQFFKLMGCGLVVGVCVRSLAHESGHLRHEGEDQLPRQISAWLHIAEDGAVTVFTGKVEMGQNIRTSLTQQVAEELRVRPAAIQLVMGDTSLTPFDMGTFGSRTTPTMGPKLREVAASAREALIEMAAQLWKAAPASLRAEAGKVTDPGSGRSVSYGELTSGKQIVKLIDPVLEAPKDWKIAGADMAKVDGRAFVTGEHKYTSDLTRPGMLYGKVLRPRAFRASLKSFSENDANKAAGVTVVRDGDFIGVAASTVASAEKGLAALHADWVGPAQSSDATLFDDLRKSQTKTDSDPDSGHSVGSIEQGFASADHKLSQTYTVAYIAHTPLEPRAAVAEWNHGKLTVWTGTQRPFAVRDQLAQAFRISPEDVRVIVPDTGSAYGGKHTGETAIEAARLAQAAGKPVKLVWTREEEFTWAYFRPAGVIDVKGGVRKDGTMVAWQFDNYNSGPSAIRTPYRIPNQQIQFHESDPPLRQGSYRGLAATANHFAREVHMDELAHTIAMDPLEFRMKNLADPRLRAVFEAAAEKFAWGKARNSSTRGFGLAGGVEKGGYVAACAEVAIEGSSVRIRRVVEAFECGAVVNPEGLRNQITGAIMQALGGAMFEAIRFGNGRILNPHLAQYRVPRFSDMPQIEAVIVDRKDLAPAGAGETPIVGLAPAVSNAIFAATGVRLRSLPMVPDGLPKPKGGSG